jgi:sugar phosphate permease
MAPFILAIALGLVMAFSCADNPANAPGTRQPEPQESEQAEAKQKDKAGEDV